MRWQWRSGTLRSNICIGERLSGNPVPGDNLVTRKCSDRTTNEIFIYDGGADTHLYYFYADDTDHFPTNNIVGECTKSVGALVAIGASGRTSCTRWNGQLIREG